MIAQRPEFYIALATMILGGQLFVAGFLVNWLMAGTKTAINIPYPSQLM